MPARTTGLQRTGRRPRYAEGRYKQSVEWPADLHARIQASADGEGMSFTDYLIARMAAAESYEPKLARYDDDPDQLRIGA